MITFLLLLAAPFFTNGLLIPVSSIQRSAQKGRFGGNHEPINASSSFPPAAFLSGGGVLSATPSATQQNTMSNKPPVDYGAIGKWAVSLTGQVALIFGLLSGIDMLLAKYSIKIPFYANIAFFYLFNLKTSIFSLLPNKKTEQQKLKQSGWEYNKRKLPSWTPPGVVFAIMWPLFVFGLRAVTASMVVSASGGVYATPAIMALMFHLCVATLWNTANNVERRLGPSVIILYMLAISKAFAAVQFYRVDPLAGKLLALTLTWLTAAAVLETNTWQINPDVDTGKKEPLYPAKEDKWTTKFRWES